jgi:hypothetical protein
MTDLFSFSGAEFSSDKKYRYVLWRIWDKTKPYILFIGLNPSTANESDDDPTIRRVKKFAHTFGYGGVYMMNLFALVTPYPEELKKCDNPIADNDQWLDKISKICKNVVFCWGSFKEAKERVKEVIKMFPDAWALKINSDGSPGHPLYLKGDLKPIKYTYQWLKK